MVGKWETRANAHFMLLTAKRTHVPLDCAIFHVNRGSENADFRPVSKFNTNCFRLIRGNPAGN